MALSQQTINNFLFVDVSDKQVHTAKYDTKCRCCHLKIFEGEGYIWMGKTIVCLTCRQDMLDSTYAK